MGSPFKKLEPFGERDAPFFFGRDSESRLIAADLFASPLSILYGESGVGKSSLLRAGVLPLLRSKADVLAVIVSEWQTDPIGRIKIEVAEAARALMADQPIERDDAAEEIERVAEALSTDLGIHFTAGSAPLAVFLLGCAKRLGRRVLLFLDQFEEYFQYHSRDSALIEQLPDVVVPGTLSVRVLISLREDAVTKLDVFEDTIPQLFGNYRRVDHLSREGAEAAIRGPIEHHNALNRDYPPIIPEDELVRIVLDNVPSGNIVPGSEPRGDTNAAPTPPLIDTSHLQLVISRVWDEEAKRGSQVLRAETFNVLGGAERIIKTHFDEVISAHSVEDQELACKALRFLVTRSGTKVAHSAADLAEFAEVPGARLSKLLQELSQGERRVLRTVRPHLDRSDPLFEVYHDRVALAILDWVTRFRRGRDALIAAMSTALRARRWALTAATILFAVASALWIGVFEPTLARYADSYRDLGRLRRKADHQSENLKDLAAKREELLKEIEDLRKLKPTDPVRTRRVQKAYQSLSEVQSYQLAMSDTHLESLKAYQTSVGEVVGLPGLRGVAPLRLVTATAAIITVILACLSLLFVLSRRRIRTLLPAGTVNGTPSLKGAVELTDVLGTPYQQTAGSITAVLAASMLFFVDVRLIFLTLQQHSTSTQRVSVYVEMAALMVLVASTFAYFRDVARDKAGRELRA